MGKIVKYCVACEESFAHKFGFCPNCGGTLKAFEMNPVQEEARILAAEKATETAGVSETPKVSALENKDFTASPQPVTGIYEPIPKVQPSIIPAAAVFPTNGAKASDSQPRAEQVVSEVPTAKAKIVEVSNMESSPAKYSTVETKSFAANGNGNGHQYQTANHNSQPAYSSQNNTDDGFRVTVIEEKNVKQRNLLLLGSMILILSLSVGGTIYSLFNKGLLVGAIDQGDLLSFVPIVDDAPMEVEEQPKPKIEKDAGGGGGGGRDEPTPTSKGQLATQMEKPMIAPTKTLVKKDFELQYQAATEGTVVRKQTNEAYGDPNSKYTLSSDGMGRGGGQGSGVGTGQGSGRGTGQGSGIGSGSGSGNGDGNGSGTGRGTEGDRNPPPPPPKKVEPVAVVSEPFKLISKPKPTYTDAARQNSVTGTVRLRVIFLASGQVGSISSINGLPYGLTEQAIAAARAIKFEPAKKNGVPIGSSRIIEYSFAIH